MGALPVSVEDHDEFCFCIDCIDRVGSHRRELGRFAGVHDRLSFAKGWQVTAVDISQAALDRASIAADDAQVTVSWACADISTTPPAAGEYDLDVRRTPG
jgi:hypothetical protein